MVKAILKALSQLPPLFIEGVSRSDGGVTSGARSVPAPHFVWNSLRPMGSSLYKQRDSLSALN